MNRGSAGVEEFRKLTQAELGRKGKKEFATQQEGSRIERESQGAE